MASGDTLLVFAPLHNEPPASAFATLDLRNQHPVLDFDAALQEAAVFTGVMPRNYGGGGLDVNLHWAMSSATTGDVDWVVTFERIGDQQQDLDSDGWCSPQTSVDNTVPATCGMVEITTIPFTDGAEMDNIAAGEAFRMQIIRDGVADTAAGDAELVAVEIKET